VARLLLVLLTAFACRSHAVAADDPPATRAFYFWRTTFRLSDVERRALADLHVARLYVRAFDVDWDAAGNAPAWRGTLDVVDRAPDGIEVVPVVFVRANVLHHADRERLAVELVEQARRAVAPLAAAPRELQLDCDWTDATRDAYFDLIRRVRAASGLAITATIRLHQVKYRERTGVPPVDRGTLMFYNMGKFSADPDARMIFDARSAERYLARVGDYPLPLDAALPIWSWTVHVRDERAIGVMQSTDPDELARFPFLARAGDDRYVARETAFLHGTLLREGDILKVEVTGPAETRAAADMLAAHLAAVATPRTVTLFDLSERNLTRHGTSSLDDVFRAVR
jgi:hypothetical protein